ncbi:hypothetical protein GE061_006333 [Apolygus lucorum]|uniref:Uncharacterized protein n=1 Tax=Apolygus lucorum TaxID=248454 RepID=A0A6A4JD35_APOLU|nr:hypothetical protein GE061_006333 [Apolygus lucorum]
MFTSQYSLPLDYVTFLLMASITDTRKSDTKKEEESRDIFWIKGLSSLDRYGRSLINGVDHLYEKSFLSYIAKLDT